MYRKQSLLYCVEGEMLPNFNVLVHDASAAVLFRCVSGYSCVTELARSEPSLFLPTVIAFRETITSFTLQREEHIQ